MCTTWRCNELETRNDRHRLPVEACTWPPLECCREGVSLTPFWCGGLGIYPAWRCSELEMNDDRQRLPMEAWS